MPEVRNPGLGAGQQAMVVSTANLTAAQIRSLNTTPIALVPSPGAGKLLVALFGVAVYHFGTRPYFSTDGGGGQLDWLYSPSLDSTGISFGGIITEPFSQWGESASFTATFPILPGDDNSPLIVRSTFNYTNGPIATATLGAGGAGYAANDTGTITTGSGDATYKVLTVDGGGAVLTFQITGPGTSYATGNGQATAVGGAQPGVGAGFTVNITAVTTGDGTLKVVTYYQIISVP